MTETTKTESIEATCERIAGILLSGATPTTTIRVDTDWLRYLASELHKAAGQARTSHAALLAACRGRREALHRDPMAVVPDGALDAIVAALALAEPE